MAIADTEDTLSVYFGCHASVSGLGGVGLARVLRHGLSRKLYPVFSGGEKVYGGELFIAQRESENCDPQTNMTSTKTLDDSAIACGPSTSPKTTGYPSRPTMFPFSSESPSHGSWTSSQPGSTENLSGSLDPATTDPCRSDSVISDVLCDVTTVASASISIGSSNGYMYQHFVVYTLILNMLIDVI